MKERYGSVGGNMRKTAACVGVYHLHTAYIQIVHVL
jgi:hypothetical protein